MGFHSEVGDANYISLTNYSEPTAQILTAIFHELSMNPEHISKIHQELRDICITDYKVLAELPHLNAVIQEAMRIHPNLLTGGGRKTAEDGVTIGEFYIPPHITIVTPHYTIARRMYFVLPKPLQDKAAG